MRPAGFTLMETVMVLIIIAIIAVFVSPIISMAVTSYDTTSRNVEVLTRMRYTVERMARELRAVRRDPSDNRAYDFATMTQTKVDLCKPDNTRVSIEKPGAASEVRLDYLTGISTTCTASGSTSLPLTDAVTSLSFTYCRIDGTTCASSSGATVDRTNVAFVDLTLVITGTGTSAYTSTTRVDLRQP